MTQEKENQRANCPTIKKLAEYLYGHIDKEEQQTILRHVQECPYCEDELAEMEEFVGEDAQIEIDEYYARHEPDMLSFPERLLSQICGERGTKDLENAVLRFLEDIEDRFNHIRFFNIPEQICFSNQYVPIQLAVEGKYRKEVETEEELLRRGYSIRDLDDEFQLDRLSWSAAKRTSQNILVLAEPGTGKSSLLAHEAISTAREERYKLSEKRKNVGEVIFPLVLRLSDLDLEAAEICEAILRLVSRDYPETSGAIMPLLKEKLKTGRCLLLLDGLDEVQKGRQRSLCERISPLTMTFGGRIICTSINSGYGGAFLKGAKKVEILPFDEEQIRHYIQRWMSNVAKLTEGISISAQDILQELWKNLPLRGAVQNPFLLSLICHLYQEGALPMRRGQLYKMIMNFLLRVWGRERKPQSDWHIISKTTLLERLAFQFTCEGKSIISANELHRRIEQYIQGEGISRPLTDSTISKLCEDLSDHQGALCKLGREGGRYTFSHLIFQRYLTASYLNRAIEENQSRGIELAMRHFWEFEWYEVFTLLAGLMRNPFTFIQAIVDERDDISSTLLLLAGRCVAECEDQSHRLVSEIIDEIYALWQVSLSVDIVNLTVVALGQANAEMFNRLLESVQHREIPLRRGAIKALGDIGNEEAIEALTQALNDQNTDVRLEAVTALGRIGNAEAMRTLIQALNDEDKTVRHRAVKILGEIKIGGAEEAEIEVQKDKGSDISGITDLEQGQNHHLQ